MTAIRNNILPSPSEKALTLEESRNALKLWLQANRPLIEVFLDAFCAVDLNNRVVDFNIAFTTLCGESYRRILKTGDFCLLLPTELCPAKCPAKQILESGKPLRLDELSGSSKAFPQLSMILSGIPIFDDQSRPLGALLTIRNVSAESELQKKYQERKEESVIDGLTRLFNKVHSEQLLLRALKAALRDGQPLSVLMCDIDHFKRVNDTYGHQAGDYVLSSVARLLKEECRDSDIIGRFGGEEFIAVLPKTHQSGAKVFAERFRVRISSNPFTFDGSPIPVTISLGSVSFEKKWQSGLNPEQIAKDLVNRADTALYFAKANGRNQCCQYELLPAQSNVKTHGR